MRKETNKTMFKQKWSTVVALAVEDKEKAFERNTTVCHTWSPMRECTITAHLHRLTHTATQTRTGEDSVRQNQGNMNSQANVTLVGN